MEIDPVFFTQPQVGVTDATEVRLAHMKNTVRAEHL